MAKQLNAEYFVPGQPILIEQRVGTFNCRADSKIIGTASPNYLLAELPMANGRSALAADAKQCVVRFISSGTVIGFRAIVEAVQLSPFPMVTFSYPQEYQEVVIRQKERIDCCLPCQMKPLDWAPLDLSETTTVVGSEALARLPKDPLFAAVVDLSSGGCQVAFPYIDPLYPDANPLPQVRKQIVPAMDQFYRSNRLQTIFTKGRLAELTFDLPEPVAGLYENIKVETRWIKSSHHTLLVGLKYTENMAALEEAVEKLVTHQNTYFKRPVVPALT